MSTLRLPIIPDGSRRVIIMRGPSCSGKTRLTKQLEEAFTWNRDCSFATSTADKWFTNEETGEYKFDPAGLDPAHATCFRSFLNSLEDLSEAKTALVIVDNTCSTFAEVNPYWLGARAFGWEPQVITMLTPLEECLARSNGHDVPHYAIERQWRTIHEGELPWHIANAPWADYPPVVMAWADGLGGFRLATSVLRVPDEKSVSGYTYVDASRRNG